MNKEIRNAFINFLQKDDPAIQEFRREIDNKRRQHQRKGECCVPFKKRFLCLGDCEDCEFRITGATKCDEFYCEKCSVTESERGKAPECACCIHCYTTTELSLDAESEGEGGTLMDTLKDNSLTPEEKVLQAEFHAECQRAIGSVFGEGTKVYDQIVDGVSTTDIAKGMGVPRKTYEYRQGKVKNFM